MSLKAALLWLTVLALLWLMIRRPLALAEQHIIGHFLTSAARGLSNFFASI